MSPKFGKVIAMGATTVGDRTPTQFESGNGHLQKMQSFVK